MHPCCLVGCTSTCTALESWNALGWEGPSGSCSSIPQGRLALGQVAPAWFGALQGFPAWRKGIVSGAAEFSTGKPVGSRFRRLKMEGNSPSATQRQGKRGQIHSRIPASWDAGLENQDFRTRSCFRSRFGALNPSPWLRPHPGWNMPSTQRLAPHPGPGGFICSSCHNSIPPLWNC